MVSVKHSRRGWAWCSLAVTLVAMQSAEAGTKNVCFAPTDRSNFSVIQAAPPPTADGVVNYAYYPLSAAATMQLGDLATSRSTVKKYYEQWSNHGPRNYEKGNIAPHDNGGDSKPTVVDFSSSDTADACTLAQTATALGLPLSAAQSAGTPKLTFTRTAPKVAETMDTCILPDMVLVAGANVDLDYEANDFRTVAQTSAFLTRYAAMVHGTRRQVILYTNPLDTPNQKKNGLDGTNIPMIAQAFDGVSVFLWSGNRQGDIRASFAGQMQLLGNLKSKAFTVFELAGTTMTDASNVRQLMTTNHINVVKLWRNNSDQGGPCTTDVNKKIACLTLGRCTS